MLDIKPIGFRVLAEFKAYRGANAIYIPELAKDNGKIGDWVVVELGQPKIMPAGQTVPIPVKIGDSIAFDPRKCTEFGPEQHYGGRRLRVVDCDAIMAVICGKVDEVLPEIKPASPKQVRQLIH